MVYNKIMNAIFTDKIFGVLADGNEVHLYTVSYGNLTFSATNYGACLTSLIVPLTGAIISKEYFGCLNKV